MVLLFSRASVHRLYAMRLQQGNATSVRFSSRVETGIIARCNNELMKNHRLLESYYTTTSSDLLHTSCCKQCQEQTTHTTTTTNRIGFDIDHFSTSRSFSSTSAAGAVAFVALGLAAGGTKFSTMATTCENKAKRPVQFGSSIQQKRSLSTTRQKNAENNEDEDCPFCRKYSQGPCGDLFQKWLDCTDRHAGPSRDNPEQENHVAKCLHLAKPLAECLEKHQDYYSSIDMYAQDDDELQEAWTEVIKEAEASKSPPLEFPTEIRPQLEYRPRDGTGMAAFCWTDAKNSPLVLAYVKDNRGQLLAAGSREDLWEYIDGNGGCWGVLRLLIPLHHQEEDASVTAFALYSSNEEEEDGTVVDALYSYTQRLGTLT